MLKRHILNRGFLSAKRFNLRLNRQCSGTSKKSDDLKIESGSKNTEEDVFVLPPEPDNCCMSGCANCVWNQYAKELTDLYRDSGGTAKKIIFEKIKDPTMQVFIKMELTTKLVK